MAVETLTGAREELDERAAHLLAAEITHAVERNGRVVLGLVGGRSVGGIYRRLGAMSLPWDKAHFFLADERLVPITSDESNYKLVEQDLLSPLLASGALAAANAHPFLLDASAPDQGVSGYDAALRSVGGRFDIALLSAGEDGHAASLFPGHPSVRDEKDGFILVEGSPKPPPRRISASRRLLARTELGVLVFFGEEKLDALAKFRDTTLDTDACPSKVLTDMTRGFVLTDLL